MVQKINDVTKTPNQQHMSHIINTILKVMILYAIKHFDKQGDANNLCSTNIPIMKPCRI